MTFNGTWKVDRNENYEKFMEQMGINMVKRKLAAHDNLKITIEQSGDKFHVKESMVTMRINMVKRKLAAHDNLKITIEQSGDKFHVKESSNFRTLEIDFTLGVTFDYSLADGTDLTGAWTIEGDVLKGVFNRKDNGKQLITTRVIQGDELVQNYNYDGVDAKRIFKRG